MKFYGYYRLENVSHGRGYGEFDADSFDAGFNFLWKEVLEIAKSDKKITECYITHIDKSDTVNGFPKRTNYGWSLNNDMFNKNSILKQMNSYYIGVEKP